MAKRILTVFTLIIAVALLAAAVEPAAAPLSSKHKAWLEDEAAFIISPAERGVFLKLSTDRERELFMEAFWKQRDPTPGTAGNEFRVEHARRIAFADATFGEEAPGGGRKTVRGRIYVTLGPPLEVLRTGREGGITEVWTYPGNQAFLAAAFFRIRFRQQGRLGEYGIPDAAVEIEPAPGAGPSAPVLLADVLEAPRRKVDSAYAERFLETKSAGPVEYSFHPLPAGWVARSYKDPDGFFRLHYAMITEGISIDARGEKYRAEWRAVIGLAGPDGMEIYREEKNVPVDLYRSELQAIRGSKFQFTDSLPVVPGAGSLTVRLENTASKEFMLFQTEFNIPADKRLWMSPVLPVRNAVRVAGVPGGASRPFQVGALQINPAVEAAFAAGTKAVVFFQVHNATPELKAAGIIEFTLLRDGRPAGVLRRSFAGTRDGMNVLEELPTEALSPGAYTVQVSVKDPTGREVLAGRAGLTMTDKALAPVWILPQPNPPVEDAYYNGALGVQYLRRDDIDLAAQELSLASYKKPEVLEYALGYAQALLSRGEFEMARAAVRKFADAGGDGFDLHWVIGRAAQGAGETREAIVHFQRGLVLKGDEPPVLNALGDCYLKTGDREMAGQAWRRSLAVKADQPDVRKKIEALTR